VTDENFYFVMADRFSNGSTDNDRGGLGSDPMVSGFDPTKKGFYNGGDLAGLLDKIDYIQGLGTTSIWLTPSFKNKAVQPEDNSAGYHGYWVTDFTQIDPHLGTNEDLRALVDAAHARGMKVYFDIITNHTADVIGYAEGARQAYVSKDVEPYRAADGTPFDDRDYAGTGDFPPLDSDVSFPYHPVVRPEEANVKVPAWLNDPVYYHNRGNSTFSGENSLYGDFFGLDDLFTEHPRVVAGMTDIYRYWVRDFGIDGFRIDTAKHVNDEFWQQWAPAVLAEAHRVGKRDFFMFGEVFDTSRPFTSHYTTSARLQAVLDFPFQAAARDFAAGSAPTKALRDLFVDDDWYTDADSNVYQLPTFLGNHDMGRIGLFIRQGGTDSSTELRRAQLAHQLMYLVRGNPVVYYGDEQGFVGDGGDQDARQDMFPSQVPSYRDDDNIGTSATPADDNFDPRHPLYRTIRGLAALTTAHPALRNGTMQVRDSTDTAGVFAFSRIDRRRQVEYVVALNNASTAAGASIPTYSGNQRFERVYGSGPEHSTSRPDARLTVQVPPLSTVVYRATRPIPRATAAPGVSVTVGSAVDGRQPVIATVDGDSLHQVTFYRQVGPSGSWDLLGTDDNAPYRVFPVAPPPGTRYQAVVRDNAGHVSRAEVTVPER
jgi:alpha-amylase